jgi:hypothetical protein
MTTIVGIFDAPEQVEQAAKRLAEADFDAIVLDETILEQEPGSIDPTAPGLVRGAAGEVVAGSVEGNLLPRRDRQAVMKAFRERLTQEYRLPDKVTDAYATTLAHSGRFVLVRAAAKDSERAMQLLRDSGASRVDKHD